jgi:phosphatidylinositol-3-phosphatase
MMENQVNTHILGNPNAPFINQFATVANQATNYFAVGHPSLPNYLEITGGSNFGVTDDFFPDWLNGGCIDNEPANGCAGAVPPIANPGTDNPVPATATPTGCNGQITFIPPTAAPVQFNCARFDYTPAPFTPKLIAHQLVAAHKTWKSYQEDLPAVVPGVNGVNYSDGEESNLSSPAVFATGAIQKLYAVKHNPFVYFRDVQIGADPNLSLAQVVDFDGPNGLWADLSSGDIPNLVFIVPNQCHDQHGFVSGGTFICANGADGLDGEPTDPLLLAQGDAEVGKIVTGIQATKTWREGHNVIVLVWDENDFSNSPNQVVFLAENNFGQNGRVDQGIYDHFSLLKTLEAGFGLPCLNHACDPTSQVMDVAFGGKVQVSNSGPGNSGKQ